MSCRASYPQAIREELHKGRRFHVVTCTCESCTTELRIALPNGKRKPPAVVANIARRRGWTARPKKSTFLCPEHA